MPTARKPTGTVSTVLASSFIAALSSARVLRDRR